MMVEMTEGEAKMAKLMQKDPPARTVPRDGQGAQSQVAAASTQTYWGRGRTWLYGEEMTDDSPTAMELARGLIRRAKSADLRERVVESRYTRWWLLYLWKLSRTEHIKVCAPSGEQLTPEQVDWDGHGYALLGLITGEMLDIPAPPPPPSNEGRRAKK